MELSITQLSLIDIPSNNSFDRLTRLATEIIGVPVALVSIIDDDQDRQYFAGACGLGEPWATQRQTPLTHSFCQHVVASGQSLSIKDARADPLVQANRAIRDLNVIAYLGVPVSAPGGRHVGALCAIDHQPREWSQKDLSLITDLAASVSDQIALRAALYESERLRDVGNRLARMLENSGQGAFTVDPVNFNYINVNKTARENLGYTLEELQKLTPADLKLDQTLEEFERFVRPLKNGEVSKLEYETVHKRKNGSTYPISIRLEYYSDKRGAAFVAFCRDITERLALEHALNEEIENFTAFFYNAPEPMMISAIDGTMLQANVAYAKLVNSDIVDLIGTNFIDLIPPLNREESLQKLSNASVANPSSSVLHQQELNGRTYVMEWTNTTHFIDGVPTKIFSIANDVTELHDAELRALASGAKMAEFIAIMSHEIRTPLNGLLGNLEFLQDTELTQGQSILIENMKISGRLLMSHVTDVLDISRYDAGKFDVCPEALNLNQFLEALISNQSARSAEQETSLAWHWVGEPCEWVNTDRNVLQAILLNLIGNAVKFTPKGSVLVEVQVLSVVNGKSDIEFRINDTGIGIEKELLLKVFDDFSTGSTNYNRQASGTGLGLGIAKRFSTVLGGEIGCNSTLGEGSMFWVRLPLVVIAKPQIENNIEIVQPKTKSQKILVVEDNIINRQVVRGMLEFLGHNVTEATNGLVGVTLADTEKFDLILMDISMPVMDGRTAARAIRASNGPSANSPIVALTANVMANERAAFLEDGMVDILSKPLTRVALSILIQKIAMSQFQIATIN